MDVLEELLGDNVFLNTGNRPITMIDIVIKASTDVVATLSIGMVVRSALIRVKQSKLGKNIR